jgi:dTDP-4-dehydrorhamnose 3,5-epimerase
LEVEKTPLDGLLLVRPEVFRDERGFFVESHQQERYAALGIPGPFVQDNHSRSARNVLRGLHYQDAREPMGKLVRCTAGRIFDVAVDLRSGSRTFGEWFSVEMDAEEMLQLWVPPEFGHGFLALSDNVEVQYKCTGYYTPEAEGTIAWDDPDIGISWPEGSPILSERDQRGSSFREYAAAPAF